MRLLIGGDFVAKNRGQKAIEQKKVFDDKILRLIKEVDATIINLENPLFPNLNGGAAIQKSGPSLKGDEATAEYLSEVGINYVTLANNHFKDFGDEGIKSTLTLLKKHGIAYAGGGLDELEKRKPLILNDEIAILNYCESESSVEGMAGSNRQDVISIQEDITQLKGTVKYIIVIMHGGHERYNLPSPRMQRLYRHCINLGASVVINHHQHCYSGYEEWNGGMIFYGLGNLFFDTEKEKNRKQGYCTGYMVELILCSGIESKLHPYVQCTKEKVMTTLMADLEKAFWEKNIASLNYLIANPESVEKAFAIWCEKNRRTYLAKFEPFTNKLFSALYRRSFIPSIISSSKKMSIRNVIRCESHRDVVEYLFGTK